MPLLDHFGLLAPLYEAFIKPKPPEMLSRLLELPVSGALLDAGGGTGRVSQYFQEEAGVISIVDLSCKMLREASKKEGLNPVCSHTETLPFPSEYFERIIMVDALHHVCDQEVTARELWRVLKPGGKLVIEEPDVRRMAVKMIALGEKILMMRSHFLSPVDIQTLFNDLDARVRIVIDGHISWVVITKRTSSRDDLRAGEKIMKKCV